MTSDLGPASGRATTLCGTALALVMTALAGAAQAQSTANTSPTVSQVPSGQTGPQGTSISPAAQTAPQADNTVGEVIVTGSRTISNGNLAPTPVTVVTSDQLRAAAPTSIADALNQLPVLANSSRPSSAGSSGIPGQATGNGQNILNLRGLGAQRTLVLLDGRRLAPTTINGTTDIDIIPQSLLARVDVVTGGASAAYGSDAVAGVVNFVLDRNFRGVKAEAQGGIADRGDDGSERFSLAGGWGLGEKGRVLASFDYFKQTGIDLDYGGRRVPSQGFGIIPNTGGSTTNIIVPDVRLSTATFGGLITSGVLAGQQFLPGGALAPFRVGALRGTQLMSGGDGAIPRTNLVPGLETADGFVHVDYDVNEHFKPFAEFAYGDVRTDYPELTGGNQQGATAYTIFSDNAFLPTPARTALAAAGQTQFTFGRYDRDFGPVNVNTVTDTYNVTGGASGRIIENWDYSGYYNFGHTNSRSSTTGDPIINNLYNAADAVVNPANGQIVCRTTLTNPGNGCVPINLFGEGSPSKAGIAYVTGTNYARLTSEQQVASFDVRGRPFSLPAGPLSVAFGFEYRREEAQQVVDPISTTVKAANGVRGFPAGSVGTVGGFQQTNAQPIAGSFDIREGFFEIDAPILRDMPFARALDFNGAVRYADYSSVGGDVTWKVGLTYKPLDDLRLRTTRSRDVRAPNIQELFQPSQQVNGQGVRDLGLGGQSYSVVQRITGNTNLSPEDADTFTAGAVYTPSWAHGLSLTVDYYNITISNVIASLTVQQVVDGCYGGNPSLCGNLVRGANGLLTSVITPTFNLAALKTSGVDLEGNYSRNLGEIIPGAVGRLGVRALASYVAKLTTINSNSVIDRAGDLSTTGVPHWEGTFDFTYDLGPFSVLLQERYIGGGLYDASLTAAQLPPNQNHVAAIGYTDLTVRYRFNVIHRDFEFFTTVNNLFDKDPPITPNGAVTTPRAVNGFRYDLVGRYISSGLRLRF